MPRSNKRAQVESEIGIEIRCSMCGDFWPADTEFFFFSSGRPHSWCKACYANAPSTIAKQQRAAARKLANQEPKHV